MITMIEKEEFRESELARMGEFTRHYLESKFGNVRLSYDMDFILDLKEVQELADSERRHLITTEEIRRLNETFSKEDLRKVFDQTVIDSQYNNWLDLCQWVLEKIDDDYERTMNQLNKELEQLVVNPSDKNYEDFRIPKWKVTNENRYNISFQELNLSKYENKIIQLTGYLTYVQNPPTERIIKVEWTCTKCGNKEGSDWRSPVYCNVCEKRTAWAIDEDSAQKERIQEALLTEEYEASAIGFQISLSIMLKNENTGKFAPGDHVSLIGKVIGKLMRVKGKEPFFAYMIEVDQIRREEKQISLAKEDVKKIKKFARKSNVLEALSDMYSPGIIGEKVVKKAILLQSAGADELTKGGRRVRGNIHILLVGDPGTGKSQLLIVSKSVSLKSLYVSDASAAGLTAAVDEINGKRVMVAGVLVLADGGIAAIDEIEKMNRDERKAIHPAMEQGEIHKSKAGLHASFKTRTSVLAAANPKYSRFIEEEPIPEQINLEPSLLDRFDLIFVFKERKGTEQYERYRALAILEGDNETNDEDFLLKYIIYSKNFHPKIPREITEKIAEYFAALKTNPANKEHFLSARTLESLQRLTLASARLRLSDEANIEDFENAKDLIDIYLKQFNFDMDAISGITNQVRECMIHIVGLLSSDRSTSEKEIISECTAVGFSEAQIKTAIDELLRKGEIHATRNKMYRGIN